MAILDDHPGLKVEVLVDGVALEEFDDQDEESQADIVTKYIEAKSGSEFVVRYSITPAFKPKHDLVAAVHMDGIYAIAYVHSMSDLRLGRVEHFRGSREKVNGNYFERKFCFSQLDTDDSDARTLGESLTKALRDIGSISMRFRWVSVLGEPREPSEMKTDLSSIGTIPEKALKGRAISHQASLRSREHTHSFKTTKTKDIEKKSFAEYCFKYRSRDALKSLCIIPRSPSPVPLEDRDVDDLTPVEMRELLRRQREREEAAGKVKQEGVKRERSDDRSSTDVVDDDEVSFVSAKRRRKLPVALNEDGVETIDLT